MHISMQLHPTWNTRQPHLHKVMPVKRPTILILRLMHLVMHKTIVSVLRERQLKLGHERSLLSFLVTIAYVSNEGI